MIKIAFYIVPVVTASKAVLLFTLPMKVHIRGGSQFALSTDVINIKGTKDPISPSSPRIHQHRVALRIVFVDCIPVSGTIDDCHIYYCSLARQD